MADLTTGMSERSALTTFGIKLRGMRDRVFDGKRIALSSDREKPYCLKLLTVEARSLGDGPEPRTPGPRSTSGYLSDEEENEYSERPVRPVVVLHDDAEVERESDPEPDDVEAKGTNFNDSKPDELDDDDLADLDLQLAALVDLEEVGS